MKLTLPGRIVETITSDPGLSRFVTVETLREQEVDPAQRGASVEEHVLEGVSDEDVIELRYENGVTEWVSVQQLQEDLGVTAPRGKVSNFLRVPPTISRDTSRGVLGWALAGLKVFKVNPAAGVASIAAKAVIANFEQKLEPPPGLFRLHDPANVSERIESSAAIEATNPALVFIHGTASSLEGSFGRLVGTPDWEKLRTFYKDQIFGFQHPTLSKSPIENALELISLLPVGARIHLVTHSRGGLVGELLCIEELEDEDLVGFGAERQTSEVEQLRKLSALLVSRKLVIERFVRVACPARGTILASRRLDKFLSLIVNVIGLVPTLRASSLYDFAKATTLELAKRRLDPRELPGLEAQMPESPLIQMLNRPGLTTKADLAVISGDVEGAGLLQSLGVLATDLFYQEDHDFVVNTKSMSGGMNRAKAWQYFERGPDVNHFNYFGNESSRARLVGWLTNTGEQPDIRFEQIARDPIPPVIVTPSRATGQGPVVLVLPGIMGSHLRVGNDRVWMNFLKLAFGGMQRLKFNAQDVKPAGLISDYYQRICDFLSASHEVEAFDFDWRLSISVSAKSLAERLEFHLAKHKRPVRILAHSMGGLVSRTMIAQRPELWKQAVARGGRLIMLGTPNFGSYVIPRLLFGVHPLLKKLALLDCCNSVKDLSKIVSRYPGVLEMLPRAEGDIFFNPLWWSKQKDAATPATVELADALKVRLEIEKTFDARSMIYVAGASESTPSGFKVGGDGKIAWLAGSGDGTVPYELGIHPELPTYYVDAEHGALADHEPAFGAYLQLLDSGSTTFLPTQPFRADAVARDGRRDVIDDNRPHLFPNQEELVAAALGNSIDAKAKADVKGRLPELQVSVSHAHLRQALYPLVVGHYENDTIVSAESELDRQLNGRLRKRYNIDLYPGPEGTSEIFLADGCSPPGALLIGLGIVGELSVSKLRLAMREVALKYAVRMSDGPCDDPKNAWRAASISALLIGTTGGNALNLADSVNAIIQGTLDANEVLEARGLWDQVRIPALELVELYEGVAAEALRSAHGVAAQLDREGRRRQGVVVERLVASRDGGRYLQPANQYLTGWPRRILIEEAKTEENLRALKFTVLTDRARGEEMLGATQRALIDKLLAMSVRTPAFDDKTSVALFELLIPLRLREQSEQAAMNLILVLDDVAAAYPWELLGRRVGEELKPLSLQIEFVRQFRTTTFREHPRQPRKKQILVVGDTQSGHTALPGAQREANLVSSVLKARGFKVTTLIKADAVSVVQELFNSEYKALHLAGHGEYNSDQPTKSGMILSEGMYLTAAEIGALSTAPEFVFLNCCHLGQLGLIEPHKMAASVARELINIGVKAVVVAGWAVNDAAACTFATNLYEALLSGQTFGRALLTARRATFIDHPGVNTWGAYQAYGNSEYRLVEDSAADWDRHNPQYCSVGEFANAFRMIISDANGAEPAAVPLLRKRLEELWKGVPIEWKSGEMHTLAAEAWANLGDFVTAIERYRDAISLADGRAPFRAAEQLINMLARHAINLKRSGKPSDKEIDALFREADSWITSLNLFGESPERYSLQGGLYKRAAELSKPRERKRYLLKALASYKAARDLAIKNRGVLDLYLAINAATYRLLLYGRGDATLKAWLTEIDHNVPSAQAARGGDFWKRVHSADYKLLAALAGDKNVSPENVIATFAIVFEGGANDRERQTVHEHLLFLKSMFAELGTKAQTTILNKVCSNKLFTQSRG